MPQRIPDGDEVYVMCPECRGSGRFGRGDCPHCGGSGQVPVKPTRTDDKNASARLASPIVRGLVPLPPLVTAFDLCRIAGWSSSG
jgi:hypothetical protein